MIATSNFMRKAVTTILVAVVVGGAMLTFNVVAQTSQAVNTSSRSHDLRPTHGTINVLLGNKNGLVVVTDSRLSDESGRPLRQRAEKLFRLNDRTVCSIAGWYSDPGPAVRANGASNANYPIQFAVPDVMETITPALNLGGRDVQGEFDVVSRLFGAILMEVARIDAMAGYHPASPSSLQITVAGYETDGALKIVLADLAPEIQDGQVAQYNLVNQRSIDVPGPAGFIAEFRGIPDTANAIMNGTDASVVTDPILAYFKSSIESGATKSLSLNDLKQIAGAIEWQTSEEYPNKVGGLLQTAVLSNGHVSEFDEPVSPTYDIPRSEFIFMSGPHLTDIAHSTPSVIGIRLGVPAIVFLKGTTLTNVIQPLDNLIVFESNFVHCHLAYSGSPRTMFDKSNSLTDTDLILLPGADANSPFIRQIKQDFPALRIIDHTDSDMTATGALMDVSG